MFFSAKNFIFIALSNKILFSFLGCEQTQVCREMGISSNTAVDWFSFCREVCEIIIMDKSKPLGGPGNQNLKC